MTQPAKTKDQGKTPTPRSAARIAAVQALYQMDLAGTDLNAVIEDFVLRRVPADEDEGGDKGRAAEIDETFFAEILRGVVRRQRDIDPMVDDQLAAGWRLMRVDSILRAILRAGVFELMERTDVPMKVVINEYIVVSRAFFSEDEPRVVNGVLDRIARKLRPAEIRSSQDAG